MDEAEKYFLLAIRFLTYRSRSTKEVRDYLIKKTVISTSSLSRRRNPQEISRYARDDRRGKLIDRVIDKLTKQKFLNDEEFARAWVNQRARYRQRGMRVVKMELRERGITDEIIEKVTRDDPSISEGEILRQLVEKKLPRYVGFERHKLYAKLGSFLARRGFDYDSVKRAIDDAFIKRV